MPILFHITSPAAALSIIRQRRYVPAYSNPSAGDSGLNAFIQGLPANTSQCFNDTGAHLILNWDGPISPMQNFPLTPDVLHIDLPYRVVVPHGTTKHLTVIELQMSDSAWQSVVPHPPFWSFTQNAKRRWFKKAIDLAKQKLQTDIASIIQLIVGP